MQSNFINVGRTTEVPTTDATVANCLSEEPALSDTCLSDVYCLRDSVDVFHRREILVTLGSTKSRRPKASANTLTQVSRSSAPS